MAITKQVLVQSGIAFVNWQYIEGCDRETHTRLENEARLKSLGVWGSAWGYSTTLGLQKGQEKFQRWR
jgi:hypothetical protein